MQAQQDTGQLYGQIGSAIAQGDQYQAGALGAASLLGGGLNTNQMWARPEWCGRRQLHAHRNPGHHPRWVSVRRE